MKQYFPKPNTGYLQTNRSDELGSLWSTFNLDFQSNLGSMRLANKLVTNTTSSDEATLGTPTAFEFAFGIWFTICGEVILINSSDLLTSTFSEDVSPYRVGDSTTQFDITEPVANTMRVTYDSTGTNPGINTSTFPIGSTVYVFADNFSDDNQGEFVVTGSGSNYFEVTNAAVVPETNKTIGSGSISVLGGSLGTQYEYESSDLAIFNEKIWATTEDILYSKERHYSASGGYGDWIKMDNLGNGTHKLAYLKNTNRLYYVDDLDTISSINENDSTSTSGDYHLDLVNENLRISTISAGSKSIWIATRVVDGHTGSGSLASGTKASIFQWDGISAQPSNQYPIESAGILAMCVLNEIPYAIDTYGRILKYTGYSFEEIQRLPVDNILLDKATTSSSSNMFIHFNGMQATKDNTILMAIKNNNSENRINENLPSGIWELDLNTGNLTHKHSFTLNDLGDSTSIDFGQNRISKIGALKINNLCDSSSSGRSTLFIGSDYYTDATTIKSAIFIDNPYGDLTPTEGQKRGYFVTTWFESPEVESTWTKIWAIYKRFKNSTDKIIFKYRLEEEDPIEATITWTSTSTFTTTTNISAYDGYEAEIIQGTGSGACTNITSVTELAGTYTATIDTAITGVTGTAKARFQKWKKIYPVASGTVKSYTEMPFDATNVRIQIKGILEWTGDGEFSKFILMDDEDIISNL